ncbi:hydroxyisourate hydrolase [Vibrio parahaemolyticus]|uniref:hydroxyisourate hydrolase n=1 Tax=Vibrio parahaemolyticus TaxID=670 RepID=UPI0004D8CBAF|nr:hydroxyisourate hydrolase [Vibrio parahaemolyticus]EGQ8685586.1 hydroxyisourate hydrolase [Vibrio parahaemolyticus]EGQ8782895.1 hydroxyisourate hydrolase [Vibrio parahaemolyticus]EGQ8831977.1 hydroxyisourate hydrolase [Vibrio parahaemolyticus]EGQ8871240.1 hydroxyisourate hydrolase [Vibrio parahaemolyticus]EGQ8879828.1 hydroxyisourate hydrolase [Vibrio parahaemolyticus]
MKVFKASIITLCSLVATPAFSDASVHVLDTNKGLPGKGIEVQFYEKSGDQWKLLSTQVTDENGRIKKFDFGEGTMYRAVFDVESFFKEQGVDSFYRHIPVDFKIDNKDSHYHIPLLLSPYAYSTYRGN